MNMRDSESCIFERLELILSGTVFMKFFQFDSLKKTIFSTVFLCLGFTTMGNVYAQSPTGFGSGRFEESYSLQLVGNFDSMGIADLNGDSAPDMVMVSKAGNQMAYLETDSDGVMTIESYYDIIFPGNFDQILMIDFNLSGLKDCIILSEEGNLLYMERQGSSFNEVPITIPGVSFFTGFHAADLDGDGFDDLILMTQPGIAGGGETYVMTSMGNSELTLHPQIFGNSISVATTDIGEDGDHDLYLAGSQITIFENFGGMIFEQLQIVDVPEEVDSILVGEILLDDPDGEFTPDLLLFPSSGMGVYIYPGSTSGTIGSPEFQQEDLIEDSSEQILANLDGTGSEDLIYLNGIEEEFQVLRADGEDGIPFGSMDHYDVDPDSTCLTVCDFNQNGVLDVAVSSNSTGLLRVFFGKDPEADFSRGDVNRDGALNLADPIVSLQSLFTGPVSGLCMDALDCDDNGTLDLSDPIVLLSFLFSGGQSLPYPFGFCDQDLTDDLLDCSLFQVNGDCP